MNVPRKPADPPMAEPDRRPTGADGVSAADARVKRDHEDDEDEWRHEPIAPVNEANPLRSLGKAVGDTVTGSEGQTPIRPKR